MKTSKYIKQLKRQRDLAIADNKTLQELYQFECNNVTQLEQDNAQLHKLITQLVGEGLRLLRGVNRHDIT